MGIMKVKIARNFKYKTGMIKAKLYIYMKWYMHTSSKSGLSRLYLYIVHTYTYKCIYKKSNKIKDAIDL